jgi:hypothetical protein
MQSYRNDQSDRPDSFLRLASRWQAAHFDFSFDQLAFAASHSLRVQLETARTAPERLTDGVSVRCECAGCWANAAVAASIIRNCTAIDALARCGARPRYLPASRRERHGLRHRGIEPGALDAGERQTFDAGLDMADWSRQRHDGAGRHPARRKEEMSVYSSIELVITGGK